MPCQVWVLGAIIKKQMPSQQALYIREASYIHVYMRTRTGSRSGR